MNGRLSYLSCGKEIVGRLGQDWARHLKEVINADGKLKSSVGAKKMATRAVNPLIVGRYIDEQHITKIIFDCNRKRSAAMKKACGICMIRMLGHCPGDDDSRQRFISGLREEGREKPRKVVDNIQQNNGLFDGEYIVSCHDTLLGIRGLRNPQINDSEQDSLF
jgi:hypothetical protein